MLLAIAPVSNLTTVKLDLASQEFIGLDNGTNLAECIFSHAALRRHCHNRLFFKHKQAKEYAQGNKHGFAILTAKNDRNGLALEGSITIHGQKVICNEFLPGEQGIATFLSKLRKFFAPGFSLQWNAHDPWFYCSHKLLFLYPHLGRFWIVYD